jgi:hypothetical protein
MGSPGIVVRTALSYRHTPYNPGGRCAKRISSAAFLRVRQTFEKFQICRLLKNGEMPGAKKVQDRSVLPVREGLNVLKQRRRSPFFNSLLDQLLFGSGRPLKNTSYAGCSKMVRCQARKKFKTEAYFRYARV